MNKHIVKFIVCFCLIVCLMIGYCSAFAHAALPNATAMQRFNAWVASALVAANITIGSTVAPIQQVLDALSYGSGMPWEPQYTYSGSTWDDDIMDRSVIYVSPDVVEIDGVSYTDVWLSNDAAQKFRVNSFDLETAWNIASNSNGTFASGAGSLYGVPMFTITDQTGTYTRSQSFLSPANSTGVVGNKSFTSEFRSVYRSVYVTVNPDHYTSILGAGPAGDGDPSNIIVYYSNSSIISPTGYFHLMGYCDNKSESSRVNMHNYPLSDLVSTPFDFDWVSGTIPAEQLQSDQGLHFLVPSEYDGGQGSTYNYDIHDLITINPGITNPNGYEFNFDPTLNPDFELDIETSDALGAIISAVIAAYLADLLDDGTTIEYSIREPAPVPDPDEPDPDVPIGEQDPIWLDRLMRWIKNSIDNLRDVLHNDIENVQDLLQDLIQTISELPEQILEEIELGPAKLIQKALDILQTLFMPLLLPIQAMMGLWHYVVEWITSISTPFTWIFGIMSGTSGNMVLPIYATLAGGICIAIYKALGR